MAFYQRLKDLKEDADITQKQAADLIGVSMITTENMKEVKLIFLLKKR